MTEIMLKAVLNPNHTHTQQMNNQPEYLCDICIGACFRSPGVRSVLPYSRLKEANHHVHHESHGHQGHSHHGDHGGHHHGDHKHHHGSHDGHSHHHHGSAHHHHTLGGSDIDVSRVAYRARESPFPMISVTEALDTVMKETPQPKTEILDYKDALGRYLAEDVFAKDPLPPFPASIKDGYAAIACDGEGNRQVMGDSAAGDVPKLVVTPGQCVRINTGAPIPQGADCVVQVEDTILVKEKDDGRFEVEIQIMRAPTVGQDIRPVGCDISQGAKVLAQGMRLGPAELGLLATVGVTRMLCYKAPVVGIMSTGNELVEPYVPMKQGKIRDSNRTTLISQIKDAGFPIVDLGIAKDTTEDLLKLMREAVSRVDIIVTSGGVSMGDKDLLKQVLQEGLGAHLHFGRVHMKPGKPTTFFTLNQERKKILFFGLPGNPVSCVVTCNLYVIPALHKMAGNPNPNRTVIKAKVDEKIWLDPRPEYHRAVLSWDPKECIPSATSTGNQLSSRLLSLSSANALLVLPPRSEEKDHIDKGESIGVKKIIGVCIHTLLSFSSVVSKTVDIETREIFQENQRL